MSGKKYEDKSLNKDENDIFTPAEFSEVLQKWIMSMELTGSSIATPTDIQRIDVQKLREEGEYLPAEIQGREAVVSVLVDRVELTDSSKHDVFIPMDEISKFKRIDFIITNDLNRDVRIAFPDGSYSRGLVMDDDSVVSYGTSTPNAYHLIPQKVRSVKLSDIKVKTHDGTDKVAINSVPFDFTYRGESEEGLILQYRAESAPTDGYISILLVGLPN